MSGPRLTSRSEQRPKGFRIIVSLSGTVIRQWDDPGLTDRQAITASHAACEGASGMFTATQELRQAAARLMWTLDNINPAFPIAPGKVAEIAELKAQLRTQLDQFEGAA
jgi:hypothetical protein